MEVKTVEGIEAQKWSYCLIQVRVTTALTSAVEVAVGDDSGLQLYIPVHH